MDSLLEFLKKEREQEWRVELRSNLKNKERTQLERISMPEQAADIRNKNFAEVNIGLSEEQAQHEARRCIDCPKPTCITGCPVGINIPKFIKKIEAGEFLDAAKVLKETNALPCGLRPGLSPGSSMRAGLFLSPEVG